MANEKRLLGQSAFINVVQDGVLSRSFKAVVSFEFTDQLEVIKEGYVGETTDRTDSVYGGTDFSMEAAMKGPDESALRVALIAKARRQAGAANRVDVSFTYAFPDGQSRNITLLNCDFGNIGWSVGGRAEIVKSSWEGSCSETSTISV